MAFLLALIKHHRASARVGTHARGAGLHQALQLGQGFVRLPS